MKKLFLTLTMLLFAFVGTMRADVVTIGDPTATTTNSYLPTYSLYEKSITQQIYTADEIGVAGTINTLTMWLKNTSSYARNINVYMKEIDETEFADATAWVSMSDSDLVGSFTMANGVSDPAETAIDLTTPFEYTGAGNLVICLQDVSGSWSSGAAGVVMTTDEYQAMYAYRDGTTYDPSNPGVNGTRLKVKNVIMLDITPAGGGGALTTNPDVLDLGYRPNGAWMAPYVFTINGSGTTVNALDFSGNYFTYSAELPATLTSARPLEVALTTGEAEEGAVNSTMTVLFGSNRDAQQFNVTANAYNPVAGDVFENAIEATAMPYAGNAPAGIYKNYDLPTATEGADAMYKVTFDNDVMFSAGTAGENAVTAIYTEDFNGQPGPMVDNNYVYNGPTVNPGPVSMWFSYAYTGSNTFFGTSAGGTTVFGYMIPAATLQELGLGNCAITTVETAAREGSYYDLMILKGGETPDFDNIVYYQEFTDYTPYYFFDINLDEPQFLGDDENLWIMFYSDSPYAAYCGRYPVDTNNGKIWYTTNLTNWYSNTNYTPMIYTRFLELPTGREVTLNLADMTIRESKPAEGQMAEANGNVNGVAKAQMQKANRGNRDLQTILEEGWEDGIGDWTMNNCESGTGVYTGAANNGSNCFRFKWTTNTPQYLISPELTDNNGGTMSFYCRAYTYTESYRIGYSTTTNDISAFTFGDEVTVTSQLYAEHTATFPAGTKYVAIASTAYDAYYFCVDDITITADVTSGGGSTDPVYQIADMYVPAGTYYVAVASTTDNFQVDMMTSEVLVPEQAFVVSPYDGETNVESPYLAEWILGDYTTEMQVLFGTQYPPQTALIDWTDYLVESAFLMDLEPNQSYFLQVNERNAAGTTYGEIVAFTTPIDPVEGLVIAESQLYPGDAAVLTWDAATRSHKGYNVYMYDGVEITKVNETLITETTYAVEGLEYNMDPGYQFVVTAVYDAGESDYSDYVTAQMTGTGTISGHVYDAPNYDPTDPDQSHPVANLPVFIIVTDEYQQVQEYEVFTDEEGFYTAEVLAGVAIPGISLETAQAYGYAVAIYPGLMVNVAYEGVYEGIDIYTHEYYYPLEQITATEEENDVLVEWSWTPAEMIVDFETGDFSQADFTLPAQYPWAITTSNVHEGTYAIKSTCEGVASGSSIVEATVDVPYDGKMGFWVSVSSESNYDKFHFYIDGVEQGAALSGTVAYTYKEYDVTEGTHTYKWEYTKDSSVNSGDDCAYVDDITMYRYVAPLPPVVGATVYDFEDGTLQGWTNIDADGDGNVWVSSTNPGIYHNSGVSLAGTGHDASQAYVISGSYANQTGQALTPDNYLVSPQISAENGAQIQFYACAQDASYAAEHFGVAVSTSGNTAAADFTTIQEWTMTAKGTQGRTVESEHDIRGLRQGNWYLYTVDLSSYAGQDIYVAIRHFNCTDMFILNVDDITLATGGSKDETRGDRSLVSYNLYRRNNYDEASVENPTLLAEGLASDVYEYIDAEWPTLSFGEWQWGIQATYAGYANEDETGDREVYTYTFDSGLEGWTNIDADGDGNVWYNSANSVAISGYDYSTLGHNGTGCFMVSQSYTDLTYDSFDADNYLVSPQKYAIDANSSITFWHDYANDSYPDFYEVMVSTAANPGANDFTSVWSSGSKSNGNGAKIRYNNSRYENWTEQTVSLAAYAGQEVWIAFHHEDYDQYEIWIDDVTITAGSGTPTPPTPPTPGPTGNGLSEILWSNVIEKDMEATLTFNITLNNGQLPYGAVIEIVGEDNEYTVTAEGATTTVEVRKAPMYEMTVTLDGYTSWTHAEAVEADATFEIELIEEIAPVDGLYVSPTGWVMWDGVAGGVTPGPGPQPGTSVTYGFEADEEGWTNIDADGDGNEWYNLNPTNNPNNIPGHDGSLGHMTSASYNGSALTPNNFLVSPEKAAYSEISFWACGQDASWAAEHFGVAVSTTGNTSASDFTTIQEWTMTAKGSGVASVGRDGQTRDQGAWYEYTVDLSAYAGQEIWVAIRHFNVSDMFRLNVDDITLTTGGAKGDRAPLKYVVKLDGVVDGETTFNGFQHNVEGMEEGSTHVTAVRPVYISGNGDWVEYTWTYTSCDNFAGVTDLAAAEQGNDVKLTWTMPGAPGPGPQPGAGWTEGFENGLPEGWTIVDGNNDGYTWCLTSAIPSTWTYYASLTLDWYRTGTNAICSGSYINGAGALTPDEYLVMGQQAIGAGTTFSFWAAATDASYPADHFGVFVSDDANTWTSVQEWTLTAKGGARNGGRESRDGDGAKLGTWHQFTVDLSAYAGTKYLAIRHFNCTDQYIMCVDDLEFGVANKGNRAMWDLVGSFTGTSAGQQAVCTDGNYIYTASWQTTPTGGHTFYQYTMDGTFVEGFEIAGATGIRDITTDGEYFYGTSGGAQIFIMDFTTRTLVGTINCSGLTSRHISYDPERDGFWSGNWSTLALYSRTGALIQNGPAPTSAYGSAYYKDADNVEHLYLFCQPNSDCKVYDYNITTGTLGTNVVLDFSATAPGCTGIAGGCFIGEYNGNTCWYGNSQQDPNLIGIFELEAGTPGPVPPTPVEGILGAMIFQDGEPIAFVEGNPTQYVVEGAASYDATYGVRVVYGGEYDVTYYAMSCMDEVDYTGTVVPCNPVTNLTAVLGENNGAYGAIVSWTEPAGATSYKIYVGDQLLGSIGGQPVFINFEGAPAGTYTIGVVAVYADCESEMVTVDFLWTPVSVDELSANTAIYPNPTHDNVTIEAQGMRHITVVSALGQVVYDADIEADMTQLNLGQFKAGLYMVRIDTENGTVVKRVSVVK